MLKLVLVTLMAFLLPILWVAGAKAAMIEKIQSLDETATVERGIASMTHARSWNSTYDTSTLSPVQRQTMRLREQILAGVGQMSDLMRMNARGGSISDAGRGLLQAAEVLVQHSNQTSDNMMLENYAQQIRTLREAMAIMSRMN